MASWINQKHQKPWNWEVKLLSSSWPVCAHTKPSPKSKARGYSPACCAWQVHIPFLHQIFSSSLGSGTARGLSASLPNLLCALSRALFADSERRNQSVIDVSDIVVSGKGRVEEGLFSWCFWEERIWLLVPVWGTAQGIFLIDLTACGSMALVPDHPGDLGASSLSRFQCGYNLQCSLRLWGLEITSCKGTSSTIACSFERAQNSLIRNNCKVIQYFKREVVLSPLK